MNQLVHAVEDNEEFLFMLKLSLSTEGIDVVEVPYQDVFNDEFWKDATVAIVDLMLPNISGLDVLKYLYKNHPKVKRILLTAALSPDPEVFDYVPRECVLYKNVISLPKLLEAVT